MEKIIALAPIVLGIGEKLISFFTKDNDNNNKANNQEAERELERQAKLMEEQKKYALIQNLNL